MRNWKLLCRIAIPTGNGFSTRLSRTARACPDFLTSAMAEINVSPTLYDLDGDGRDEIIFTCGTSIIALHGDGSLCGRTKSIG